MRHGVCHGVCHGSGKVPPVRVSNFVMAQVGKKVFQFKGVEYSWSIADIESFFEVNMLNGLLSRDRELLSSVIFEDNFLTQQSLKPLEKQIDGIQNVVDLTARIQYILRISNYGRYQINTLDYHSHLGLIMEKIWNKEAQSTGIFLLQVALIIRILGCSRTHSYVQVLVETARNRMSASLEYDFLMILCTCELVLEPLQYKLNPPGAYESYTPIWMISIVKRFCGDFHTDASGNYWTQKHINSVLMYNKSYTGLHPTAYWYGNVWVNPPYTSEDDDKRVQILPWVEKAISEWTRVQKDAQSRFNIFMFLPLKPVVKWFKKLEEAEKQGLCVLYEVKFGVGKLANLKNEVRVSTAFGSQVLVHFTSDKEVSQKYFLSQTLKDNQGVQELFTVRTTSVLGLKRARN